MSDNKRYPEKVFNREAIKAMVAGGSVWSGTTRAGEDMLNIQIQLEPGVYEVQEGDTLSLVGLTNNYRTNKETGEINERAPHFNVKVKQKQSGGSGSYGGRPGGY